tara:strand:- start:57889 stop:58959 length:1071 start_codon:yes stop_codon:yes gene_type:complete
MTDINTDLKTRIIDKIIRVLYKNHSHPEKQKLLESKGRLNFACPYCGDSVENNRKKRGNIYWNDLFFHCYNCSMHTSLDNFLKEFGENFEGEERVTVLNFIKDNRKNISFGETLSFHLFEKMDELSLPFDELSLAFNIYRINERTYRAYPYLKSRLLHRKLENFAYDPRKKELYIFNLTKSGKIVGFQIRNLEGIGPRYKTWNLERIYNKLGLNLNVADEDVDNLNKISMLFGILQVNMSSSFNIFEGPLDSLFMRNSIGLTGVKKAVLDFDNVPTSRYFFDNDKDGKHKMIDKLKNEQYVFMWSKFCKDYNIPSYGKSTVKDLNDLVIFEFKNRLNCLDDLDKYFTNNPLDIMYL